MKASIILNGHIDKNFLINNLDTNSDIYAVDGAYNEISSLDLPIKAILGDFDSITKDVQDINVIQLEDQNFTDFDKTIYYLKNNYQEIIVYGGSGGELDHCLGNLFVANKYIDRVKILFMTPSQKYFLSNKNIQLNKVKNTIISLIPITKASNITTDGLKYELQNENLKLNQKISIRNLAIKDRVQINFEQGTIAIFLTEHA